MFRNLPCEPACQIWCPKNGKYDFIVLLNAVYGLVIYFCAGCHTGDVGCTVDIAVFVASVAVITGVAVVYFK